LGGPINLCRATAHRKYVVYLYGGEVVMLGDQILQGPPLGRGTPEPDVGKSGLRKFQDLVTPKRAGELRPRWQTRDW
ncbi:6816_t:CDS:2, partial [Cetraspora pellucida]